MLRFSECERSTIDLIAREEHNSHFRLFAFLSLVQYIEHSMVGSASLSFGVLVTLGTVECLVCMFSQEMGDWAYSLFKRAQRVVVSYQHCLLLQLLDFTPLILCSYSFSRIFV